MTHLNQIWKCNICGNIVEIVHAGSDSLVCCGEPMQLMKENVIDASKEKHVPVIQGNKVLIGTIPHQMLEEHFIEWIEASDGKHLDRIFLKPGNKPEAEFCFQVKSAREFCNLHGLWKN